MGKVRSYSCTWVRSEKNSRFASDLCCDPSRSSVRPSLAADLDSYILRTAEDVGIQLSSPGSNGRMSERGCKSASLQQSRQADG